MSKVHNLEELQFALRVSKDFPEAIKRIDNCQSLLYDYREYIDIAKILQQLEESKILMEVTYEVYKQIAAKKGVQE